MRIKGVSLRLWGFPPRHVFWYAFGLHLGFPIIFSKHQGVQSLVTFLVGDEEFAACADALLTVMTIRHGENASDLLQLALQYHQRTDTAYCALDLRHCLAISGKVPSLRKLLVIDSRTTKAGFLVDAMVALQAIDERKMQSIVYPSEIRRGIAVVRHSFYESRVFQVLDYAQILRDRILLEREAGMYT